MLYFTNLQRGSIHFNLPDKHPLPSRASELGQTLVPRNQIEAAAELRDTVQKPGEEYRAVWDRRWRAAGPAYRVL